MRDFRYDKFFFVYCLSLQFNSMTWHIMHDLGLVKEGVNKNRRIPGQR